MYKRHETGKIGEDLACEFLIKNGLEIIERNFRCKIRWDWYYSKR